MKKPFVIALFILSYVGVLGQTVSLRQVFRDYIVTENLDTISALRKPPIYWYGALAGVNYNLDFGELKLPRKPYRPPSETNPLITYRPESGAGYFFGAAGEWTPDSARWGVSASLFWDRWVSAAYSDPFGDTLRTRYESENAFNYLTISIGGKYQFWKPGLFAFADFEASLALGDDVTLRRIYKNIADLNQDEVYENLYNVKTRFGGRIGVGYDMVILSAENIARVKMTPFAALEAGSSVIDEGNYSWNAVKAQIGVSFKIGYDRIKYDTIKYVPEEKRLPKLVAFLSRKPRFKFPELSLETVSVSGELASAEKSIAEEEFLLEPVINESVFSKPEIIKAIKEKADLKLAEQARPTEKISEKIPKMKLIENVNKTFYYPRSEATDLTKELRRYLDQVAVYLKEHPRATLGIVGHSDNRGTFQQNDQRAKERAQKVVDYLVKKGISRYRLLATGKGALEPIASNKTEWGRRKNRRVEIKIVPSPKDRRR